MKLVPFEDDDAAEAAIKDVLNLTGLKRSTSRQELDEVRQVFETAGAGVEQAAKTTAMLMRAADKEETKLRACELALKVAGIFKEIDEKQIPSITINVVGTGNQTLVNLLCPQ